MTVSRRQLIRSSNAELKLNFVGKGDFLGSGLVIGGCAERNTNRQVETKLVRQELRDAGMVGIVSSQHL